MKPSEPQPEIDWDEAIFLESLIDKTTQFLLDEGIDPEEL